MDERKVAAGLAGETRPLSGVGVSGADVIFDSLLGPIAPEPALRRWVIMFPFGDASELGRELPKEVAARSGWLGSVGVGGVLTMSGAPESADGGVCGGRFKGSIFWLFDNRRMRSDEAGFETEAPPSRGSAAGTGSTVLSAAADFGLLSSLGLFSALFLPRKTSRSRLADDCFESDWGGVSPVWLGFKADAADSMLFSLP
jgi:hypothetical protein